jgi:hypothetical protein
MVRRIPMEIGNALRELARLDPYAAPGYLWKNPFNPRATGRRWTPRTLEFFQRWQIYERQNLDELAAQGGAAATVTNTYLPEAPVPLSPPPSST